jgi:hypothetical protein
MVIVYDASTADGNSQGFHNAPILLVNGCRQLKGGRHIRYSSETPLTNHHRSLFDRPGGWDVERLGDSSGTLTALADM